MEIVENEKSIFMSERSGSQCEGDSSFEVSRIEEDGNGRRRMIDYFQLKSPTLGVNMTAQQHFNNKSAEHSSGNTHIPTSDPNNSQSNISYKERSLLSPGIEREFSEIDEFLKETYEKFGIYDLVRQFVDMEDQLVSTFEYLKKLQRIKNERDEEAMKECYQKRVSCFEEINEVDEFSFEAEENIIHEFLYNLQQFFIPSENNDAIKITEEESEQQSSSADYSFSEQKPEHYNYQNNTSMMITSNKKHGHIHTSRSKQIINNAGLQSKDKRNVFSDEKMIQGISLNRGGGGVITPLKFDESSSSLNMISNNNQNRQMINHIYNVSRQLKTSIRKTNSEIIGEESIESENYQLISYQEELLKTIFELRQEVLTLKQEQQHEQKGRNNKKNNNNNINNGCFSSNESSFVLDNSLGEQQQKQFYIRNFKENSHYNNEGQEFSKDDSLLLDSSREYLGSMLLGCNNNLNCYESQRRCLPMTINSYTRPLIINKEENINELSEESNSTSTFKLDMLETVKEEEYHHYGSQYDNNKENDPNSDNVLEKYLSNSEESSSKKISYIKNTTNKECIKNPEILAAKFDHIVKTESNFITEQVYISDKSIIDNKHIPTNHFQEQKRTSKSETLSNFKNETNLFIEKFFDDFKLFFKTEMEIQLILLSMIKKKKSLKSSVYGEFHKMIEWYSKVTINRGTRIESVGKFTYDCLKLKGNILEDLKRNL